MRKKKPDNDDDHQVLEEWLELKNGCLCCSLKDPGVKAIEDLIKKGGRKFGICINYFRSTIIFLLW